MTFTLEDIIVTEPKPVDENLQVELAVIKTIPDGSSVVISSEKLTQILLDSVDEINQGLNGLIRNVAPKFPKPTTQTTPNSEKTTMITQRYRINLFIVVFRSFVLLPNSMSKFIHNRCTCKFIVKTKAGFVYAHEQLQLCLCFYVLVSYYVVLDIYLSKLY